MTIHEEQYRRKYPLANIDKGPGTKALLEAKPEDSFTFGGTKLIEGDYYFNIPRSLVEVQHLGGNNLVLWLYKNGYPRWVERVVYNGHSRAGLSELWEKQLSSNATAEEKAEHEDAGSTTMLPVPMLWAMSAVFGLLLLAGIQYGFMAPEKTGWAVFLGFIGVMSGMGMVEFAGMAIWKHDRDQFWRALDVINSLDLRRPPKSKR